MNQNQREYVSFSELKKWSQCPYARDLAYNKGIRLFNGNSYTAFGTAIHETIEQMYSKKGSVMAEHESVSLFRSKLEAALESITDRLPHVEKDFETQGENILKNFEVNFEKYFGKDFEIFSIEEELNQTLPSEISETLNFKGFIDMVVRDKSGKYHIVDWKTCSWGWNAKKRSDPMVVYQLTFYKNFFCQKHNIDPSKVETHFGLLKRTSKGDHLEFFHVTSGKRRIANTLAFLTKAIANISNGPAIKNRLSCKYCEYYGTEHCK